MWNWALLKKEIGKHGLRNSLLVAPMPTASTSQILGNNEACEPYTTNIYTRRVLAGEFVVLNKYLVRVLTKLKLWNEGVKNIIIADAGSVQVPPLPSRAPIRCSFMLPPVPSTRAERPRIAGPLEANLQDRVGTVGATVDRHGGGPRRVH